MFEPHAGGEGHDEPALAQAQARSGVHRIDAERLIEPADRGESGHRPERAGLEDLLGREVAIALGRWISDVAAGVADDFGTDDPDPIG